MARSLSCYDGCADPIEYSLEAFKASHDYSRRPAVLCKGGAMKVIGMIVAVVVTVYTGGAAAGMLASSLGSLGSAVAGGAIGGALGGMAGAIVSGGNIGRGALYGGIGGAVGGGLFGMGDSAGLLGGGATPATSSTMQAGADGAVNSTAGSFANAAPVAGDAAAGGLSTGSGNVGLSLSSANAGQASLMTETGGLVNAAGSNTVTSGLNGAGAAVGEGGASVTGGLASSGYTAGEAAAPTLSTTGQINKTASGLSDTLSNGVSSKGMQDAGLKLGSQYLGSLAQAPGSAAQQQYLDSVRGLEQQAQAYNLDMANRKAAVGDKLQSAADNIDPAYYAQNSATSTANRDASTWADQEAAMRARGSSQEAIDAERHRQGVMSSQNYGTSYATGYNQGTTARNNTYASAGSMYGGVSAPSAGLSGAYAQLSNNNANAAKAWGGAIESAFGVTTDATKKASQNS